MYCNQSWCFPQVGRQFHYGCKDRGLQQCSHLSHLTPAQLGTHSQTHTLYWSAVMHKIKIELLFIYPNAILNLYAVIFSVEHKGRVYKVSSHSFFLYSLWQTGVYYPYWSSTIGVVQCTMTMSCHLKKCLVLCCKETEKLAFTGIQVTHASHV